MPAQLLTGSIILKHLPDRQMEYGHIFQEEHSSVILLRLRYKSPGILFEDESGAAGPLLTVNNFTPSRNVTLDSATSVYLFHPWLI